MKTTITTIAILLSLISYSQSHEHYIKAYQNLEDEIVLRVGGNDKDVLSIGGFTYAIQYETNIAERSKFSFAGGMYWNTFLDDLKVITDVNWGLVWSGNAAGLRFGAITGLEYELGNLKVFGGAKYDEFENKIKPLVGVGIKF